jgi:hypothetical protein
VSLAINSRLRETAEGAKVYAKGAKEERRGKNLCVLCVLFSAPFAVESFSEISRVLPV